MQHSAFLVEHNKGGVAETARVAEAFHGFVVLVGFGGIDVDVDEVVSHKLGDFLVLVDEFVELEAPRAPVAAHLANEQPVGASDLLQGFVNLLHGVDFLVVGLFHLFGVFALLFLGLLFSLGGILGGVQNGSLCPQGQCDAEHCNGDEDFFHCSLGFVG